MLKLNLGCNDKLINGFINIDFNPLHGVVIDDARYLRKFEEDSVDLIYASNILEHFGRWEYKIALRRWYDLLKQGGILRISVPDFEALCEYYTETKDLKSLYPALYAGQDNPHNYHYWCWDFVSLKGDLEQAGFTDIQRYNRDKTGYAYVRDWSLNFVPYRDENDNVLPDENWFKGTFIALNVEAKKDAEKHNKAA